MFSYAKKICKLSFFRVNAPKTKVMHRDKKSLVSNKSTTISIILHFAFLRFLDLLFQHGGANVSSCTLVGVPINLKSARISLYHYSIEYIHEQQTNYYLWKRNSTNPRKVFNNLSYYFELELIISLHVGIGTKSKKLIPYRIKPKKTI